MNAQPEEIHEHGVLPLLLSMISTRAELAAIDAKAHIETTFAAMMITFIAVVMSLIAFAFIGVVVIVMFWDTHRIAAASAVLAFYALVSLAVALLARSAWRSRPAPFAATLHELELDRAAFGSRS
jgi:uncharacterized membrane protein YqjE